MTGVTIKPVPGYGDALSDLNRVPVLTLADRVRRDIMLPVLDRRSDSVLVRSQAQFMRSENGSALIRRNSTNDLELLQTQSVELTTRQTTTVTFDNPGLWIGIYWLLRDIADMTLSLRSNTGKTLFYVEYRADILWWKVNYTQIYIMPYGLPGYHANVQFWQYG